MTNMMTTDLRNTLDETFQFQEYCVILEDDSNYQEILQSDELQQLFIPIELESTVGCIMSQEVYNTLD